MLTRKSRGSRIQGGHRRMENNRADASGRSIWLIALPTCTFVSLGLYILCTVFLPLSFVPLQNHKANPRISHHLSGIGQTKWSKGTRQNFMPKMGQEIEHEA